MPHQRFLLEMHANNNTIARVAMYSGPGVNWNHDLLIAKIQTQSTSYLKFLLKSTSFLHNILSIMARIEVFKCIRAGFKFYITTRQARNFEIRLKPMVEICVDFVNHV